jgi:regulator of replication initiation timing
MKTVTRLVLVIMLFEMLLMVSAFGGESAQKSYAELTARIDALEKENAALKTENQQLRAMLALQPSTARNTETTTIQVQPAVSQGSSIQKEAGYWITTSSGVRHNSSCRYYKNSRGRLCGPDEGRPCKICGG